MHLWQLYSKISSNIYYVLAQQPLRMGTDHC